MSTGTEYEAIDGTSVHKLSHVYRYEALTSSGNPTSPALCLQLDTTSMMVDEGICADGNSRQQWDWNGTSGNLASVYEVNAGAADSNVYTYPIVIPGAIPDLSVGSCPNVCYYSWDIADA
jgi:hypothetical protein